MDIDNEDPGYQIMQDSEILDLMTNKAEATAISSSTTSSDNEGKNIIGASEAFTCLDIVLRWFCNSVLALYVAIYTGCDLE